MNNFVPYVTYALLLITVIVSIIGFTNANVQERFVFHPPSIARGEGYRFFSNGLIHADFVHLIFNMYALFGFGRLLEANFVQLFGQAGASIYAAMYIAALPVCLLPTYFRNRHNDYYTSLGASGAVSAVIFATIVLFPNMRMGLIFIPIPVPGYVFGLLYLLLSTYLDKRGGGNINHSAHIWGALFGVVFIIVACMVAGYPVLQEFLEKLRA